MQRALVLLCLMLLSAGVAYAHTFVIINNNAAPAAERFVSSMPAANQALDQSPSAVTLTFSQPIRPGKSGIKVYDLYGTQINDDAVSINGAVMSASLPPLPPGRYAVKWKARCLCDDGNDLSDEFHFTIR